MKKTLASLMIIFSVVLGCSKDEVKRSPDSLLATEAFSIIDKIKKAYEEKNEAALKLYVGTMLVEDINKELTFEKARLSFTPRMVRIADKSVRVNLNWRGSWTLDERSLNNRGAADLVFHRESMKLTYIEGDNPFLIPVIRSR